MPETVSPKIHIDLFVPYLFKSHFGISESEVLFVVLVKPYLTIYWIGSMYSVIEILLKIFIDLSIAKIIFYSLTI
jgi:hypothetical protein